MSGETMEGVQVETCEECGQSFTYPEGLKPIIPAFEDVTLCPRCIEANKLLTWPTAATMTLADVLQDIRWKKEHGCLFTVDEVATMLAAAPDTVRGWLRKGILRGEKASWANEWWLSPDTVATFLGSPERRQQRKQRQQQLRARPSAWETGK